MSSVTLTVEGLSVAYRRPRQDQLVVVRGMNLELDSGQILGLAGESGCGKSTVAVTALGLPPQNAFVLEGRSVFRGRNLLALKPAQMRALWGKELAYVPQNAALALNPAIPIGRQVGQVLAKHLGLGQVAKKTRTTELLEAVGMPDPERASARYPHEFSGGQLQRVAIAIALSCEPRVIVLDEPTTGLDVTTQARVNKLLLRMLRESGTASLYVSHDVALLSAVADRLVVMYGGESIEEGPATSVVNCPRHPYTRALLGATPVVHERRGLRGVPGQPPDGVVERGCAFAARCEHVQDACREAPVTVQTVANHGARCIRIEDIAPTNHIVRDRPLVRAPGSPVLSVRGIRCEYAGMPRPAVDDVSLTLGQGEAIGIVGESGSGKSTLLRAIAGLQPWQAGEVLFHGVRLPHAAVDRSREVRGQMQMVFQNADSSLNPRHSVSSTLSRSLRLFRPEISRAQEEDEIIGLLESVKLQPAVLHRFPAALSGGQRQRVAIARAFAARPHVLLCDEITSALDVSVQATIVELVAELASEFRTAVIFVSHDLALVRTIAARTLVMKDGQVCEEDETDSLFASPVHPYTKELLASCVRVAN